MWVHTTCQWTSLPRPNWISVIKSYSSPELLIISWEKLPKFMYSWAVCGFTQHSSPMTWTHVDISHRTWAASPPSKLVDEALGRGIGGPTLYDHLGFVLIAQWPSEVGIRMFFFFRSLPSWADLNFTLLNLFIALLTFSLFPYLTSKFSPKSCLSPFTYINTFLLIMFKTHSEWYFPFL